MEHINKIFQILTSTRAAGLYLLLFAIAIGVATFIENDYGTSSAQNLVFRARWFELLLILFGLTILVNIKRFRMIEQKKWATLSFHLAIIIILIGSAVTRYFGSEGMMHIRENEAQSTFLSAEQYINFKILQDGKAYSFAEPVFFSTKGSESFKNSYQIANNIIEVELKKFIPNPQEKMSPSNDGVSTIKVVFGGASGREEYFIRKGDRININGVKFNFTDMPNPEAFNIFASGDSLSFIAPATTTQMVMATQTLDTLSGGAPHPLKLRAMYKLPDNQFVFGDYRPNAIIQVESENQKMKNESFGGLDLSVKINGKAHDVMVTGRKGEEGRPQVIPYQNGQLAVSYGAKKVQLPFSLKCRDFIMEKYPGTDNPSSYASEVTVIDPSNSVNMDYRIFMNNILDYGGYRFFQSSFDPDEAGTYLSVNHDFWGTWISYIGYALLTLGMGLTFFTAGTRFSHLKKRLGEMQKTTSILLLLILCTTLSQAQQSNTISGDHAKAFSKLIVQDHKGRLKPMNTLCSEVLRKLSQKETANGLNADQTILSMMLDPAKWEKIPLIKPSKHPQLDALFPKHDGLLSYIDFFDREGQYKLREYVRTAQNMNPRDQGTFEKAVIKLDEKVNIANMVFSGRILRMFPQPNDETNTWISPEDLIHGLNHMEGNNEEAKSIFLGYMKSLTEAQQTGNYTQANDFLNQISIYQQRLGSHVMPSKTSVDAELLLNKLDAFSKLRNYYGILSLLILLTFFYSVLKQDVNRARFTKYAAYAMAAGFIFHTIGLALRWYVSGRAPWSNGYESMIYIGWTTVLAGTLFSRKSLGGLGATATLAATILLVASMSWLDPEISPLVPVLKSYWLTIHVSLEAGSYGFLMLGAVLGMLNLLLMIFIKDENKTHITKAIKELTMISEITLLGGLFMVSIGTYLGGVWANESWGRYWGWDAKETWALVTILVYSFILHMRFIPGLQSVFAFSFASLFGFGTVIMTYLGVNYYLSGLHSYAAGDPVPIPPVVYYTTASLVALSIVAYLNYRKKIKGLSAIA